MGNDETTLLSAAEVQRFQRIAGLMIPADAAYAVPAASDPAIFDDILSSLGRDLPAVRIAISALRIDGVDDARAEAMIQDFLGTPSPEAAALSRAVLQCYYRDDRVLAAIGHEARPPYPGGHVIEQGDWSVLDPVRTRPPFWRDDRRT
jgi:hypothetical protein